MARRRLAARLESEPRSAPAGYLLLWVVVLVVVAFLVFVFWPRQSLKEQAGLTDAEHDFVTQQVADEALHQREWRGREPTDDEIRARYLQLAEDVKKARKR